MLKFFREAKAYTSIFLCLVLLPMVTYSAMIIDASRLQSARVQVQSAGDLAMNAAMSEYEQVLEDMYGLFANASSKDEIEPVIRQYFEETISGKLTEAKDGSYVKQFANALTEYAMSGGESGGEEKEYTNFLQMKLPENTSDTQYFTYSPILTSDIANPKVMKGQIVDYMKYKGPVSVGQNFLNKLGFLKDTKAQSDAVQEKITLTEKISDLGTPMDSAYEAIQKYNAFADIYNKGYNSELYSQALLTIANEMETNFKDMIDYILMYETIYHHICNDFSMYATDKDKNGLYNLLDISEYTDLNIENVNFAVTPDAEEITEEQIITELKRILNELNKIKDVTDADQISLSEFENLYGQIYIEYEDDEETGRKIAKNVEYYSTAINDSIPTIASLKQWKTNLEGCDTTTKEGLESKNNYQVEYLQNIKNYAKYKAYYEYFRNLYLKYCNYMDAYQKLFENNETNETYKEYDNYHSTLTKLFTGCLSGSSEQLTLYKEFLALICERTTYYSKASEHYEAAIKGFRKYYSDLGSVESGAKESVKRLEELESSLQEVNKQVETCNTTLKAVEDDATKSQMSSDIETLAKSVNPEDVKNLKELLKDIGDTFGELRTKYAEKVEFWGDKVYKLNSGKLADYINQHTDDLAFIKDTEKFPYFDEVQTEFNKKYPNILNYDSIVKSNTVQEHVSESMVNKGLVTDKVPATVRLITGKRTDDKDIFYNVLAKNADASKNKPDDTTGNNQKNLDEIKEASKIDSEKGTASTSSNFNIESPTEAPKAEGDYDYGKKKNFEEAIEELSAGTFQRNQKVENSIKISEDADDAKKNGKENAENGKKQLSQANKWLEDIAKIMDGLKDNVYLEEYFTEMFTCQTDPLKEEKMLTLLNGYSNNPEATRFINPKNAWYGKEMEYILWGDKDLGKNLQKTEMTIFLIRFAINAIYAFTASDIQSMASSIATFLVGWTVVLVPVVQVCIVLAVALAESAIDLQMLKDGKDVPLIKDSTTFICSPSGAVNAAIDYGVEKVTNYAVDKVSEGIDALADKANATIEEKSAEVGKVVEDYINQQTVSIETAVEDTFTAPLIHTISPALSKLDSKHENADRVLRETITLAWGNINTSIEGISNDTVKSAARTMYNEVEKRGYIDTLINEIKAKTTDNIPSAGDIEQLIYAKVKSWLKIDAVATEINNKLEEVRKEMTKNLTDYINSGADNLKEYAHEQIEAAGDKISGKAKEVVAESAKNSASNLASGATKSKSIAAKITMNYKEYCKLFVFIELIAGNEDAMLNRAAVLMQLNVNYAVKGSRDRTIVSAGTKNFKMTEAYTMFYVHADMQMGTLFPWAVKVDTNETGAEASLDLSHLGENSVNLRYSGMAGY